MDRCQWYKSNCKVECRITASIDVLLSICIPLLQIPVIINQLPFQTESRPFLRCVKIFKAEGIKKP